MHVKALYSATKSSHPPKPLIASESYCRSAEVQNASRLISLSLEPSALMEALAVLGVIITGFYYRYQPYWQYPA